MSLIPWTIAAAAAVGIDYLNPIAQPGEPGYCSKPVNHLRFVFENDSAFGHDMNYTHGSRIEYVRDVSETHAYSASFTQNIYTPEVHTDGNIPGQRPYAGYLAVGCGHLYKGEYVGNATEFQIGTTGKPSFAEDSQRFVHTITGIEQWDGWGDQLDTEVTFQLTTRQDYRLPWLETTGKSGLETDAILYTREEVGTVSIAGGMGISLRYGRNLPPYMQVNGNEAANYGVGTLRKEHYRPEETSWFIVGGVYVEYVARDMFIDGGAFHPFDQTCSRKPWQVEGQLGLGVVHRGISYYAGGLVHSRAYRTQNKNSVMGTFAVSWNW